MASEKFENEAVDENDPRNWIEVESDNYPLTAPNNQKDIIYDQLGQTFNSVIERNGKKYIISITLYTVGFLILISGPWVRTGAEVTMLDVGQGDCICVQGPKHQNYLIDGGSSDVKEIGKYRIEPFLKSRGIAQLDYVFLSHGDLDHMNGIEELLMRQDVGVRIRNLVVPGKQYWDERILKIITMAKMYGTDVKEMEYGTELKEGEMKFTVWVRREYG